MPRSAMPTPSVPTHAQQSAGLGNEQRALTKRGADFCRRDPAAWSRSVLRHDQLVKAGWGYTAARLRSLEEYEA